MEDVLDVYTRPYDPRYPQVCMDEVSKQLLRDTRAPLPATPGNVQRVDYEYEREGVVNRFLCCEPLHGQRWVTVTDQRTKVDWAQQIKNLVDVRYPAAERIVLVLDKPEYPQPGIALRGLSASRSEALGRQAGDPLHPETWQVAQHGRERTQCPQSAMLRPAGARRHDADWRGCRVGGAPQYRQQADRVALHER